MVVACLTLAVGHQGVKVVDAAQAVASCTASDCRLQSRLQRYQSGWLAVAAHSWKAKQRHFTDRKPARCAQTAHLAPGNW